MPVVAKISPYETQAPVSQSDYMIGFEIGEAILNMADLKNYTSTTLGFIGEQNPFLEGQLRPVLWEKVDASRFPTPKQIVKDSLAIIENTPNTTFEFTSGVLRYFLQNQTKTGRLSARHFKVLSTDRDSLVFDKVFKAGEGANLLRLNTVQNKKQNIRIAIWTGKLFKDKPPIITDFISHSFGCPEIYFLEDSEPPISIRCDNRH